jgi:hypothetical protein
MTCPKDPLLAFPVAFAIFAMFAMFANFDGFNTFA